MLRSIYYLLFIYLYLSFLGAGLYLLLAPAWLRKAYYLPFAVPVLGSSVLSVLAMYVICLRLRIAALIPITLIAAGVLLLSGLLARWREVGRVASELRKIRPRIKHGLVAVLMVIFVMLAVLWPAVREGAPTVPFRVGPDQMGNACLAQFFLAGGGIDKPSGTDRFRKDIWIAKEAIDGMRWGCPAALATYNRLLGSPHTYRVAYPAIALHLMLLGGLAYCLLYYRFGLSRLVSLLGGAAVTLNCNMLNAIYEGFWAQLFIMPIFVSALMVVLCLRDKKTTESYSDVCRSVLLLSLLALSLVATWAEGTQILIYFWIIIMLLDFVFKRKVSKTNLHITLAVMVTLLLAFPALPMLKQHYINVTDHFLRISGWAQPQWAFPSEILGFSNIYHHFTRWFNPNFPVTPRHRPASNLDFNIIASLVIVVLFLRHIFTARSLDKSFWLAAPIFVLIIFLTTYWTGPHNFLYMKSYTLCLPLLFVGFFGPLSSSLRLKTLYKGARYALSVWIIIVGLIYVHEYSVTSSYTSNDMFELQTYSHSTDLSNVVFITRGPTGLPPRLWYQQFMLDLMICPLLSANTLDQWVALNPKYNAQHFERHFGHHAYLLARKSDLPSWPCVVPRVVWENATFAIIDTGKLFGDAFPGRNSEPDLKVFWGTIQPSPFNTKGST